MPMFDSNGQPQTIQALLNTVVSVSGASGVILVSALNTESVSFSGDAANNRVSAIQADASNLQTSAKSGDASLFRISAIGTLTVSAHEVKQSDAASLRVSDIQGDAGLFRVSGFIDSGSVSAKSSDAGTFRVSAINSISALSPDAALFRVSGIGTFTVSGSVSTVITNQPYISAFIDNGSISAKSSDAATFRISAINSISALSPDAGLFLISAKQGDAGILRTSAFNGDYSQFITSARVNVDTRAGGGASLFSTSAGIAQVSTVKSSGGRLYGWHLGHAAGVDQFLQIFNTSGGATLGTDVPTLTIEVPAGTGVNAGGGAMFWAGDVGIGMATGIQIGVTSTAAGNTAGASAMRVNIFYA